MTSMTVSPPTRRQTLRSQRRWKVWRGLWRFFWLATLAGGLSWGLSQPHWLIQDRSQLQISGQQRLSPEKIAAMVEVSYPQSLWTFPSQSLREQLRQVPPVADVQFTRSLFPPQIRLQIQEREPVAVAISEGKQGFLDGEGVFIAADFYEKGDKSLQFPLNVLGYSPHYAPIWQELYPLLQGSSVKIRTLDWRNPNNLILQTELGTIHLGSYHSRFPQQLALLPQLKALPQQIPADKLVYIDLSNPDQPTLQLKHEPEKQPLNGLVKKP